VELATRSTPLPSSPKHPMDRAAPELTATVAENCTRLGMESQPPCKTPFLFLSGMHLQ